MSVKKDWTAEEIAEVVATSGKPLEVHVAESFLAAGSWRPILSSYFEEKGVARAPRELDVLVTREATIQNGCGNSARCRLSALISCKGLAWTQRAVAFSVANPSLPGLPPVVLSQRRLRAKEMLGERRGPDTQMEGWFGERLIEGLGLEGRSQLIAFDVAEAKGERRLVGDRTLFEGIDSAVKASLYWRKTDATDPAHFCTLYVPMLVLSHPWFEVPVDGGTPGTPRESSRGYMTCRMPIPDYPETSGAALISVTFAILAKSEIPAVIQRLEALFMDWREEATARLPIV